MGARGLDGVVYVPQRNTDLIEEQASRIGHDRAALRGDLAKRDFSLVYLKAGKVITIDCVNCASDYVQGRMIVGPRLSATAEQLSEVDTSASRGRAVRRARRKHRRDGHPRDDRSRGVGLSAAPQRRDCGIGAAGLRRSAGRRA